MTVVFYYTKKEEYCTFVSIRHMLEESDETYQNLWVSVADGIRKRNHGIDVLFNSFLVNKLMTKY